MKKPKFLRKDTFKKSRLGKRRKKKQKWRRPRGRHSKIREKRRGYGKQPSIGYGAPTGLKSKLIYSPEELDEIKEGEIVIVGKVGKKRKIEIAKKANEKKIKLSNLNTKAFLEKVEREKKKKLEKKKEEGKKEKSEEKTKEKGKEREGKKEKSEEEKIKGEKEKKKIPHKEGAKPRPEEAGVKRNGVGGKQEKKEMFRKALEK